MSVLDKFLDAIRLNDDYEEEDADSDSFFDEADDDPEEIFKRCSTLTDAGIEELKTFPAIICRENTDLKGVTDPNQWALYAYINKVRVYGKDIKIAFQPIGPIRQQVLCSPRNAIFFDLNMDCAITDLNHSAWSVRKTNLFEAFKEAGINNIPMPSEEVI